MYPSFYWGNDYQRLNPIILHAGLNHSNLLQDNPKPKFINFGINQNMTYGDEKKIRIKVIKINENINLWWHNGHGTQCLHDLNIQIGMA